MSQGSASRGALAKPQHSTHKPGSIIDGACAAWSTAASSAATADTHQWKAGLARAKSLAPRRRLLAAYSRELLRFCTSGTVFIRQLIRPKSKATQYKLLCCMACVAHRMQRNFQAFSKGSFGTAGSGLLQLQPGSRELRLAGTARHDSFSVEQLCSLQGVFPSA